MLLQQAKTTAGLALICWYLSVSLVTGFGEKSYLPNIHLPSEPTALNFIDKLNEKLDDIRNELKTANEQLTGLEAELSLLQKLVAEIETIVLEELDDADRNQDLMLHDLWNLIRSNLMMTATALRGCINDVEGNNDQNNNNTGNILERVAANIKKINNQNGAVASLNRQVEDFYKILSQEFDNDFASVKSDVGSLTGGLAAIKGSEKERTCETGVVILNADDRRAEHLFKTPFQLIPQVHFSLSCYNFEFHAKKSPEVPYWDYFVKESNSIGVYVASQASLNGITFEKFNLAFGNTANEKVCVSFQACSLRTGTT